MKRVESKDAFEERDFFEDFTTLKWVKWTKQKPDHEGSVTMRFNYTLSIV